MHACLTDGIKLLGAARSDRWSQHPGYKYLSVTIYRLGGAAGLGVPACAHGNAGDCHLSTGVLSCAVMATKTEVKHVAMLTASEAELASAWTCSTF